MDQAMYESRGAASRAASHAERKGQAVIGVAVLTFCNIVAIASTQILNILVDPIKADLAISDVQFSLLQGFAFFVFASLFAIPAARIADRGLRRNVILFGVIGWTLAVGASAWSRSFGELFVARVFVGIGEVFLAPAAISLITDLAPKRRLGVSIGVFVSGMPIGAAAAMFGGGWLLSTWPDLGAALGLEHVQAWRVAFVACALFGVLAAALLLLVREPSRKISGIVPSGNDAPPTGLVQHVRKNAVAFAGVIAGILALSFAAVGAMTWLPSYFVRAHGLGYGEAGRIMSVALLAFAGGGTWICGYAADLFERRGRIEAPILVMSASVLGLAGAASLLACVHVLPVAVATVCVMAVFIMAPGAVGPLALSRLSLPHMRAQVFAVFLLLSNLIAGGLGPSAVALLTDQVFRRPEAVGSSIAVVAAISALISLGAFAVSAKAYRRCVQGQEPTAKETEKSA